jgi:hypothetical protein
MTRAVREDVVAKLLATGKWSEQTAQVAERADYHCEYCDLDLLATPESYKLFEIDHIVPLCAKGAAADFENLALSCRHCNFHYKRTWDPRSGTPTGAGRAQLVLAVREHIVFVRNIVLKDLQEVWRIVGRSPTG